MTRKIAILQSNYIPWKGYFDLMASVDEFIIYDEVQFTRQDWRNRNRIKTADGPKWLTIPVAQKGRMEKNISEIEVLYDSRWAHKHWATICQNYLKAPFFKAFQAPFQAFYEALPERKLSLSAINYELIQIINQILGIHTPILNSADFEMQGDRCQRLIHLCQQRSASHYLSGPAAQSYLDESLFQKAGIEVQWMDYSRYPEYPQLYPPFDHAVSVVDLIFNVGPDALSYLSA